MNRSRDEWERLLRSKWNQLQIATAMCKRDFETVERLSRDYSELCDEYLKRGE